MPTVRFADGVVHDFPQAARVADVIPDAIKTGPRKKRPIAALLDGKAVGLDAPLPATGEATVDWLPAGDPRALPVMRHSAAHIMARAVMRLFPEVELAFGPTVGEGFYYDMRAGRPITDDDLPRIEAEMRKIIEADEAFERVEVPREKAVELVRDMNQPLKAEHIETGLAAHPTLSFYRQGEFVDLCRGPHVPSPGCIGAFKLTNIAGAYWKGDANNAQLQSRGLKFGNVFFVEGSLGDGLARRFVLVARKYAFLLPVGGALALEALGIVLARSLGHHVNQVPVDNFQIGARSAFHDTERQVPQTHVKRNKFHCITKLA
jgi:threonyl-tRNA synthetase